MAPARRSSSIPLGLTAHFEDIESSNDTLKKTHEVNWEIVQLDTIQDWKEMERVYKDFILNRFPRQDVEPLEYWKAAISLDAPEIAELHCLVAYRKHTVADAPLKDKIIEAAFILEYYSSINCGLITWIVLPPPAKHLSTLSNSRQENKSTLVASLLERSVLLFNELALQTGALAGCNAIFFEYLPTARSDSNALHSLGFRLVDIDYTIRKVPSNNPTALLIYLTPRIPKIDSTTHYLPSVLLHNLLEVSYASVSAIYAAAGRHDLALRLFPRDELMEQIDLRERIILKEVTTTKGEWTLVDLWEDWDEELCRRFWEEFFQPNFEEHELEPVANWIQLLTDEDAPSDLHILLALKWPSSGPPAICGGIIFDYHPESNNGLINYLFVSDSTGKPYRSTENGLDSVLLENALQILDWNAKTRGNLVGCNMIFLETFLPGKAPVKDGRSRSNSNFEDSRRGTLTRKDSFARIIDDVTDNHQILYNMGFRLVSFQYILPPMFSGQPKSNKFMLTVYTKPFEDEGTLLRNNKWYLPSSIITSFVTDQWNLAYLGGKVGDPTSDPDYLRMIRQLNLREHIPLLELPWLEGVWTFVDMWNDYDEALLRRFYEDVMIPAFPNGEELEPLEVWLTAYSDTVRDDPDSLDLHCLLALKWPTSDGQQCTPSIAGGCVFEYYPKINCALISYLVCARENEELLRLLVAEAVEIIDSTARSMGHIAGCNCIFWEEKAELSATDKRKTNAENFVATHVVSYQLGFRQVDTQYIIPPVSPAYPHKLKNWLLTVMWTSNIPRLPFEQGNKYCIPSLMLKNFLQGQWQSAYTTGRINQPPEKDPDYVRVIQQISVRQNIPLLDLPWSIQSWVMVDLWEDYSEDLIKMFYKNLLIPNFPIVGELEPLETWLTILQEQAEHRPIPDTQPELHVILAMKWLEDGTPVIGGGAAAEYYKVNNCGLITYLVVHKSGRGSGLARVLVEKSVEILDKNARHRGKLAGCNTVFLETNAAEKVTMQQDVMDPRMRHTIYHKIGFRMLDFAYIMPPLGPGQDKMDILLLTVYLTKHIPTNPYDDRYYLPSILLQRFIKGQWAGARAKGYIPPESIEDPDYLRMIHQTDVREKVPLFDLPWGSGKPWIVVDMWEDYDAELMSAFYADYLQVKVNATELESIDNWQNALSSENRDNPKTYDLHILIAFNVAAENVIAVKDSQTDPNASPANQGLHQIIGGLVFEYYPLTNCTLVTHLVVDVDHGNDFNRNLAIGMMKKMVRIADSNAKEAGHIAGCSCIFLEVPRVKRGQPGAISPTMMEARLPVSTDDLGPVHIGVSSLRVETPPMSPETMRSFHGPQAHISIQLPTTNESSTPPQLSNAPPFSLEAGHIPKPKVVPNLLLQSILPESTSKSAISPGLSVGDFDDLNPSDPLHPTFLYSQGFRIVNFPYYQPPIKADVPRPLLLTVFVTPRIPRDHSDDSYYIPPALLRNVIEGMWTEECEQTSYDFSHDEKYRGMMERCEKLEINDQVVEILNELSWGVYESENVWLDEEMKVECECIFEEAECII